MFNNYVALKIITETIKYNNNNNNNILPVQYIPVSPSLPQRHSPCCSVLHPLQPEV